MVQDVRSTSRALLVLLVATVLAFSYPFIKPHIHRTVEHLWGTSESIGHVAVPSWVRQCAGRRFFTSSYCTDVCIQQAQLSVRQRKPADQIQTQVSCHRCPAEWFEDMRRNHSAGLGDPIWSLINNHGDGDEESFGWGSVLDAGTGQGSLHFITRLNTTRWSAVTASPDMHSELAHLFADSIRPGLDQLLLMNWDSSHHQHHHPLLQNQTFDVVLADYLLGAMDGFSPYKQDQLFEWLRPYVGKRLYFVGKEPIPDHILQLNNNGTHTSSGARLFLESERLRDACLLMAGDRPYREYPSEWVLRALERASFIVEGVWMFPVRYVGAAMVGQLRLCRNRLHKIHDPTLRAATLEAVENLQYRVATDPEAKAGFCFGMDYVIAARPK